MFVPEPLCSKQACQVTPAIYDADDLDFINRALVGVGMRFK
jgi:hypothetical protein